MWKLQGWKGLRSGWVSLGPSWEGLRASLEGLKASWEGPKASWEALRAGWEALRGGWEGPQSRPRGGRMDERTDGRNFSPFYILRPLPGPLPKKTNNLIIAIACKFFLGFRRP